MIRSLLCVLFLLPHTLRAAEIISDTATWAFGDFLTYRNATSKGWNFGNTAANAPTVTLLGTTIKGNLGVADAASGLSFTTAPLIYAVGTFAAWTGAPEQASRDSMCKGGLHGGSSFFAMKLNATPGASYVLEVVALDALAVGGRSMDVIVDGVTVKDDWYIPIGTPFNRVIRMRVVADADGIDLRMGRGGIAGTDQNPAIAAVALTEEVSAAPVIGTQPCGMTQSIGGRAEFSVLAGGTQPLSYQWRRDGNPVGTNLSTLVINPVTAGDAGSYDVIVTNSISSTPSIAVPLHVVTALTPGGTGILQNLVGYWRFDETQGCTAADTSGQHNSGKLFNFPAGSSTYWTAGKVGGALRFDGPASLQHVIVSNFPKTTTAYTLSAWVQADTIPTWASIAKNWFGEFHFGLDATGNSLSNYLGLTAGGQPSAREPGTFSTGSWQHVVCTVDGANIRLYRNGVQVAATAYSGTWFAPTPGPLGIGVKLTGSVPADAGTAGYWDGLIDDLALWNRALSASEVFDLYSAGAGGQDITHTAPPTVPTTLVINEYLADNAGGLEDEDRDSPDWIELFNGTAAAVNLDGYYLSDNPANLTKWRFPAVTLNAGQYLLVFASNKDRRVPGHPLHTNFVIDPDGEELTLTAPNGTTVVHRFGSPLSFNATAWYPSETNVSVGLSDSGTRVSYYPTPTPNQANVAAVPTAGAIISNVTHAPAMVTPGTPIVVSAKVQADQPDAGNGNSLTAVNLKYRVMFGTETTIPMNDSGTGGDATAADGIWSATIPAGATAGQMVRWAVTATTSRGNNARSPRFLLPRSPEYHGTVISAAISTPLPVIHRFVQDTVAVDTIGGTRCSLFYDGEFYDNLGIRIRGNTSRSWPKKSHKIDFNPGYKFRISNTLDRVSEINLNTTYTDKSYVRAMLATRMHQLSGIVSPDIFPVQVRQNGAFYSVALYVENVDDTFLKRHGIDDHGALYKAVGDTGACDFTTAAAFEKKSRYEEGYTDMQAVVTAMGLTGSARDNWLYDNIDMPSFVNWWAGVIVTQNIDASNKNYYVYRDTNGSREWQVIPWDLDLSFGPNALNTDSMYYNLNTPATPACTSSPYIGARPFQLHAGKYNRLLESLAATPRFRAMFTRRIRSLSDQFLSSGWFATQIDGAIPPLQADVDADHALWGANSHFSWSGAGIYTLIAANNRIKAEYLTPRVGYLTVTNGGAETINWTTGAGSAGIPLSQSAAPVVNFGTVETNPASGNQDEEYIQLTNPGAGAVDMSGWTMEGGVNFTFKGGTVIPAGESLYLAADRYVFRQRTTGPRGAQALLVVGDFSGHLSNFSETLTLKNAAGAVTATATTPSNPSDVQRWLRITEVDYNPLSGTDDEEFIEVTNTSPGTALTLAGLRFTEGIVGSNPSTGAPVYFTFPAMTLAPGASTLVVRNQTAFLAAFPTLTAAQIAGVFPAGTALDNGGETVKLDDVDGSTIDVVSWDDVAPWPVSADGQGKSLHFVVNAALIPDGGAAARWFAWTPDPGRVPLDADGDGHSDFLEFRAGTNPGDGRSFLNPSITLMGGTVQGSFPGIAGKTYRVQTSADLTNWSNVGSDLTPATDGVQSFTDTPPAGSRHYYRIALP